MRTTRLESDGQNLIGYVNSSLENEEEFHFLRFEFLNRLNIVNLEIDLVRMKSQFQKVGTASDEELEILQKTMHDYADAIRDYQYLRSKKSIDATDMASRKLRLQRFFMSKNDFKDPFQSHYSYFKESGKRIDPLRKSLMRRLPSWLSFSAEERRQRQKEYHEGAPPNEVSRFVDGLVRFGIAFTGGAFLVVPMIIMVLDPSQTKSLVTVSAFVVLFSLLLSLVVRVSNVETLVSTATYAAVLVVFVGTSTNNQST